MAITKIQCLNEAHTGNPAAHLRNALLYIQNPEKTEENVLVGSINCLPDTAFEQMMDTKVTFGKQISDRDITLSFPLHREKRQRNRRWISWHVLHRNT